MSWVCQKLHLPVDCFSQIWLEWFKFGAKIKGRIKKERGFVLISCERFKNTKSPCKPATRGSNASFSLNFYHLSASGVGDTFAL